MIIKTYLVKTLEEAEQLINRELGPDAVILTSRQMNPRGLKAFFVQKRVEVTAAVDEKDWEAFQTMKGDEAEDIILPTESLAKKTLSEADTHILPSFHLDARLTENLQSLREQIHHTKTLVLAEQTESQTERLRHLSLQLLKQFGTQTMESTSQQHAHLRDLVREEVDRLKIHAHHITPPRTHHVGSIPFLVSKGLSPKLATQVDQAVTASLGPLESNLTGPERIAWLNALKRELAALIKTSGPISLTPNQPTFVSIVGPAGVGKTTTLIKLALQYQDILKKEVAIISLDQQRVGAQAQIHALAEKFNIPLAFAPNATSLERALSTHEHADLVLLDTGGCNPYQWQPIDELADILSTLDRLQIYLAISATTKDLDVYGIIHHFTRLNIDSLIFTKLDETIAHGILINTCYETQKPLSYLTTGPNMLQDLKIAEPDAIARSLLTQHNTQEFDVIREKVDSNRA